jgi:hypothetical protein
MSLLFRAAVLGAIAYFITRSLSTSARARNRFAGDAGAAPIDELHPGENNVWPTSENQPAAANAGPSA